MLLQITTLIENSQGEHLALKIEHGLSFFIHYKGKKILFDTGQSEAYLANAEQLQIDLSDVDHVVLSHGHYDHSGGLKALTHKTRLFTLWMGKGFFVEKYGYKNNCYEYLGNNFTQDFLDAEQIAYRFVQEDITEIVPGIYIVTNFPRIHPEEKINPRFVVKNEDTFSSDPFTDEILIAIDTPKGLVVVLGCSHPGMRNMLDAVTEKLGRPIYAVLGGTHLVEAEGECLSRSIEYLKHEELQIIGVSHCTGQIAMERMSESNSHYFHNSTGSSLYIEN